MEKETKIDSKGRITVPIEFRSYFPDASRVKWIFDGKKLVVIFQGTSVEIDYLTDEYLMNQISNLKVEIKKIQLSLSEQRKVIFNELTKESELTSMLVEEDENEKDGNDKR